MNGQSQKLIRETVRSHHSKNEAHQTCTRQIASNLTPSKGGRRGVYKTVTGDVPFSSTTTRLVPTDTTAIQSRQPTQHEVVEPTTRLRQPSQQIQRPARKTAKTKAEAGGKKHNWDEPTIRTDQTHQTQALNTTNPNTTINHTTAEDPTTNSQM